MLASPAPVRVASRASVDHHLPMPAAPPLPVPQPVQTHQTALAQRTDHAEVAVPDSGATKAMQWSLSDTCAAMPAKRGSGGMLLPLAPRTPHCWVMRGRPVAAPRYHSWYRPESEPSRLLCGVCVLLARGAQRDVSAPPAWGASGA